MSSIVSQTPREAPNGESSAPARSCLGWGIAGTALTFASLCGAFIEADPPSPVRADDNPPPAVRPESSLQSSRPTQTEFLQVSTTTERPASISTISRTGILNDLTVPPRPLLRPERPVVLFGGGPLPELGVELFSRWIGGPEAELLVIAWGSTIPDKYFADISAAFEKAGTGKVTRMPDLPEALEAMQRSRGDHFDPNDPRLLLARAKGVFFAGGNQNKLYDGFLRTGVEKLLIERIDDDSLPVAGTSAGTAIMSQHMICGSGKIDESWPGQVYTQRSLSFVGRGLSVLPNIITDQHFDTRKRLPRLEEALRHAPEEIQYALGIDESAGGLLVQKRYVMATGPGSVTVLMRNADGTCAVPKIVRPGTRFDLHTGTFESTSEPMHTVEAFERLALVP